MDEVQKLVLLLRCAANRNLILNTAPLLRQTWLVRLWTLFYLFQWNCHVRNSWRVVCVSWQHLPYNCFVKYWNCILIRLNGAELWLNSCPRTTKTWRHNEHKERK